jgi:hypothetical protein
LGHLFARCRGQFIAGSEVEIADRLSSQTTNRLRGKLNVSVSSARTNDNEPSFVFSEVMERLFDFVTKITLSVYSTGDGADFPSGAVALCGSGFAIRDTTLTHADSETLPRTA